MDDFKPAKRPAKSLHGLLDVVQRTPTPTNQTFHTPEEVAAVDDIEQPATLVDQAADDSSHQQHHSAAPSHWWNKFHFNWPPGRREWIIIGVVLLLVGAGLTLALTRHHPKPVVTKHTVKAAPKVVAAPTTEPSKLTGLPVDPSVNRGQITGVMVENSLDARPQAGLSQAGVVFEAIAEGGITRFLALYEINASDNVGPIRSSRPYYIQWALGFDASYAHVGGSPDALQDIRDWGVHDLDQFYNSASYHRSNARAAPHNVYTGIGTLNQLETSKGYTISNFDGFVRKKEEPSKTPGAKRIGLDLSGPTYNVHYDYNPTFNSYNRSEGGQPHIDGNTNNMLSPKVVIALVMSYSLAPDGYHSQYNTLGSGSAYVFQDGNLTMGTWTKNTTQSQFTFTNAQGKPLALNPGQTWITAVSGSDKVTATP